MKWYKIAAIGVLLVCVLLIIFGIPANFLVGALQSRFEAATGYQLHLGGRTTVSFWPAPTISLRDVALLDGGQPESDARFRADNVHIALSFSGLLSGRQRITELRISRPTLRVPLSRVRRTAPPNAVAATPAGPAVREFSAIDRIVVDGGTVAFYGLSARSEGQIDHINLDAAFPPTVDAPSVTGSLEIAGQLLRVELRTKLLPQSLEGQAIPVELKLQGPALSNQSLSATAELRSRANSLAINSLSGRFAANNFNGWAAVDFSANKPLVKADLDFDRLQIQPEPGGHDASRNTLNEPWSDRQFDFNALNFFDAQVRVSASDFTVSTFHVAPTTLQVSLEKGVLNAKLENTSLYEGTAEGTLSLDASGATPLHAMHVRLTGVNALPMLSDVADFGSLEGTLQATIDVNASGASQRTALSSLAGAVDFQLVHGAIRGIDVSKLMHNLTNTILEGWHQNPDDKTPLTDLTATFSLANGVATTTNLTLTGPIARMTGTGSVDIGAKTLQLRVDPRLIVSQQDASGAGTGLGVPVVIQGDWSAPRIYPDVAGILNDPASAFDRLKAAGQGLFGFNRQSGDSGTSGNQPGNGNGTLDSLIGGFLKGSPDHGGGFFGNRR